MKKQKGFILPGAGTFYVAAGAAFIITLLGIALWVQTGRVEAWKGKYEGLVAQTKAAGDAQDARTKIAEALHREIVKEKDNENATAHAALAAVSKRLRDRDSRRGLVPPATPGASRPDLACYNRAELDDALRAFTGSVGELVIEGESSTIDLDTGKAWVKALGK